MSATWNAIYKIEILINRRKRMRYSETDTQRGLHLKRNFLCWKERPFLPLTSAAGRFLHVDGQSKGMTFPFSHWYKQESCFDMWFPFPLRERDYAFAHKGEKHGFATSRHVNRVPRITDVNHNIAKNKGRRNWKKDGLSILVTDISICTYNKSI